MTLEGVRRRLSLAAAECRASPTGWTDRESRAGARPCGGIAIAAALAFSPACALAQRWAPAAGSAYTSRTRTTFDGPGAPQWNEVTIRRDVTASDGASWTVRNTLMETRSSDPAQPSAPPALRGTVNYRWFLVAGSTTYVQAGTEFDGQQVDGISRNEFRLACDWDKLDAFMPPGRFPGVVLSCKQSGNRNGTETPETDLAIRIVYSGRSTVEVAGRKVDAEVFRTSTPTVRGSRTETEIDFDPSIGIAVVSVQTTGTPERTVATVRTEIIDWPASP